MIEVFRAGKENEQKIIENIRGRNSEISKSQADAVDEIIINVAKRRDSALFEYTEKFDGFTANKENIKVSQDEIEKAYEKVDSELLAAVRLSVKRVEAYHEKLLPKSWRSEESGETLGQTIRAVERAGVYVPGGKASYPSSVIMNVIPAKVAGVSRIAMVTPCGNDGKIPDVTLVAANEAGVHEIYKIGGAQAIAALAYGTETIPKVQVIVGPGNSYVALAKKAVFGEVNIDSIAGPSEIMILADDSAVPAFVAADMLSQAEHDEQASAILVTDSERLAFGVLKELAIQTGRSPRKEIIEKSLRNYGAVVIAEEIEDMLTFANEIAPEHLEICMIEAESIAEKIKNAGAVFVGNYSPEPIGDYMAGPNHVLPTGGTAKFFSPLSVDHFIKKTSYIKLDKEAMLRLAEPTIKFAESEGLFAHAESVRLRTI